MKFESCLTACLATAVGVLVLTGCSHSQAPDLVNEIAFALDGVSEVVISYDEEAVTFHESESDELIIREYMTENKSSYYAKVEQSGGSIKIREGGKPLFKNGFSRRVAVYLPKSYHEALTVTTTEGDLDFSELALELNVLRIDSTAGTVTLSAAEAQEIHLSTTGGIFNADRLKADTIRVDTTSGDFCCERLAGSVAYTTTSGNADIRSAAGSGSYQAKNSGKLRVVYTEVTGDLSFLNKNDDIYVTLPADLEFAFEATTKNGTVSTTFPESVSLEGRTARGVIGAHPVVTVKAETNNGNIAVSNEAA